MITKTGTLYNRNMNEEYRKLNQERNLQRQSCLIGTCQFLSRFILGENKIPEFLITPKYIVQINNLITYTK